MLEEVNRKEDWIVEESVFVGIDVSKATLDIVMRPSGGRKSNPESRGADRRVSQEVEHSADRFACSASSRWTGTSGSASAGDRRAASDGGQFPAESVTSPKLLGYYRAVTAFSGDLNSHGQVLCHELPKQLWPPCVLTTGLETSRELQNAIERALTVALRMKSAMASAANGDTDADVSWRMRR